MQTSLNIVEVIQPLTAGKAVNGFIQDEHGNLNRVDKIKKHDLNRDTLVKGLAMQCALVSNQLQDLKANIVVNISDFIEQMFTEHNKKLGGKKGNVTLFSYDKSLKIERSQQDRETTNEHILIAKQLVDECLKGWSKGANKNLQAVVQKYFRTDGKGSYNIQDLKRIMRMKIGEDDANWQAAMKALSDSIEQSHTETYYRAYYRTETGSYNAIPLNITDIN